MKLLVRFFCILGSLIGRSAFAYESSESAEEKSKERGDAEEPKPLVQIAPRLSFIRFFCAAGSFIGTYSFAYVPPRDEEEKMEEIAACEEIAPPIEPPQEEKEKTEEIAACEEIASPEESKPPFQEHPEPRVRVGKRLVPPDASKPRENYFSLQRLSLRDTEGKGIGYRQGYASLDALFAADYRFGLLLPMLDIRAHHLYNNTYAGNVGLVARYLFPSCNRIWGVNAFYDFRHGRLGNYNQLGLGFESLGIGCDFRLNAHLFSQTHRLKCLYTQYLGGFFQFFEKNESSFQGFDAEFGRCLLRCGDCSIYGAAGPYYLLGKSYHGAWGGRARIRPQYKDCLALELSGGYDSIFHTNYQVEIIFSLPLYAWRKHQTLGRRCPDGRCVKKRCLSARQIYQPVERFEIIPLKSRHHFESNF